jgi:uncharacterized protein (TIGR02145 family)
MTQYKDNKRFFGGLNTDADPSELPEGDYVFGKNIRTLSSKSQHGAGPAETLQSEIEILIAPDTNITYYGGAIGGSFVYSGYNEVVIGTQTWMKKNWDAAYPGSKVQDDEETNRAIYGGLYTHNHIMATDFCPDGWRVPTEADIDILIAELLGSAVAGGHMKEVGDSHWTNPNTGADDSRGFRAVPGGKFDLLFDLLGDNSLLWLQDEGVPVAPVALNGSEITYNSFVANWKAADGATGYYLDVSASAVFAGFMAGYNNKDVGNAVFDSVTGLTPDTPYYFRVRAYNEVGAGDNSNTGNARTLVAVTDADGNMYSVVTIGTQQWLVENLKTTKYADGTPIPNLVADGAWIADITGAYCYYNNDIANKTPYGALYNWYAVDNAHGLAPTGWRVPSDADLTTLSTYLGVTLAGQRLKESGTLHWTSSTGTNDTGFTGVGGGWRHYTGGFSLLKNDGYLWSTIEDSIYESLLHRLSLGDSILLRTQGSKNFGLSVRCMRDIP